MQDLEDALSDIRTLRSQLARSTEFRGYSAPAFAATGLIAIAAATAQPWLTSYSGFDLNLYLALWVGVAVLAVAVIGADVLIRSRRAHSGLADEMIYAALEQLLPAAVAGALLSYVIVRYAAAEAWMLPGLWQIVLSLGVFASCRSLPAPLIGVGVWYLATGLVCIGVGSPTAPISPWAMGAPFGIGQLLAAALIHRYGGGDA